MCRCLLSAVLFLMLSAVVQAYDAAPIAPVKLVNGRRVFRTPVMMLDKKHLLKEAGRRRVDIDKDLYAALRVGHDGSNLLFHVYIHDSHIENTQPAPKIWAQDGVEIFLAPPEGKNFACGKTIHFMISAPDKNDRVRINILSGGKIPVQPEYAGKRVKDGYEITLKVPFKIFAPYDICREKLIFIRFFGNDWDPSDGDPAIKGNAQPRVLVIPVAELRQMSFTGFALTSEKDAARPHALNAWWMPEYLPIITDDRLSLPLDCPLKYDAIQAVLTDKQGKVIRQKRLTAADKKIGFSGIGNAMELTLTAELYSNGRKTGYVSLPYINLQSVMDHFARIDLHKLAEKDPVRTAAWLNVISTVESLKFSAARSRPETREIIRELHCRLALLTDSPMPEGISGKQEMIKLASGFQAQIAVEFDHRERPYGAERVFVSIPWGNIPLVQAQILFFSSGEIASNYLKWRMAFTVPEKTAPFSGADEVAAGKGHLFSYGRKKDLDYKRTAALFSPRRPDLLLNLPFEEAAKLAPSEVILCPDSPLDKVPIASVPGRREPLIAYSGSLPAHAQMTQCISAYGVAAGILMARKGSVVYETSWNNPELDRKFMQLLLDNRPLTAAFARELRDLRHAELVKKFGKGGKHIPLRCGDMHTHTIYSDGSATPAGMLAQSLYAGLDFLIFTDHNRMDVRYYMDDIARKSNCRFNYSCGIEATYHNLFHLNIFPLTGNIDLNCRYRDIYLQAKAQGALIQLNHPFSTSSAFDRIWFGRISDTGIDAVERNISRLAVWRKQGMNMLVTGGTDTHTGCFSHMEATIIGCEKFSDAAIVSAFRKQQVAMVAPRLGEYLAGPPEFVSQIGGNLLPENNPAEFGRRLAEMLKNFNAAEYIRHSSPVSPLPNCFILISPEYNRHYQVKSIR